MPQKLVLGPDFDPAKIATQKGYKKYFSYQGNWFANVAGTWQLAESKEKARSANIAGTTPQQGITGQPGGLGVLPGLGEEVASRALGATAPGEEPETPQDKLIADLTSRLTAYTAGPSLIEEKKRLEEEKGVLGMRETVGSFEEEMATTQTLLDQLEGDITQRTREFLVAEPARRRILATERKPLIEQLGIAERGLAATTGRLARTEQDILTELGLLEKERTMPMDLFERELNIRSKIKDLTTRDIPNVATSTFNDEGDLTIVTQDPTTGAFNTQTLKGIGKKASEYEQFSTIQNAAGDVTVIGIKRDGTTENLGVFKGAGKGAGVVKVTDQTRVDEITTYFESVKNEQGKVSSDDYISAQRNWIAGGGNITDFKSAFPTDMIQEERFITKDWFIKTYGQEALIKTAKEEGYGKLFKGGKAEMDTYLEDIMKSIEAWRQAGKSDQEILKEMMK